MRASPPPHVPDVEGAALVLRVLPRVGCVAPHEPLHHQLRNRRRKVKAHWLHESVQRSAKRLVRGREKFHPALA